MNFLPSGMGRLLLFWLTMITGLSMLSGCGETVSIPRGSVGVVTVDGEVDHREIHAQSKDLIQGSNGRVISVFSVKPYDIAVTFSGFTEIGTQISDILFTVNLRIDPNRVAELHKTYPNTHEPPDGEQAKPGYDHFLGLISGSLSSYADSMADALETENVRELESLMLEVLSETTELANTPMLQFVYPTSASIQHGIKKLSVDNTWESRLAVRLFESEMYPVTSGMTSYRFLIGYLTVAVLVLVAIQLSKITGSFRDVGLNQNQRPSMSTRLDTPDPSEPPALKTKKPNESVDNLVVKKNKRRVAIDD